MIEGNLKAEDQVIIQGLQRARPGIAVKSQTPGAPPDGRRRGGWRRRQRHPAKAAPTRLSTRAAIEASRNLT